MDAMDFSHHLSTLSKSRSPSPLKDIMKYMFLDGMVSLAGGLPHPSLFPFASCLQKFDVLMHSGNTDAWTKGLTSISEAGEYIIIERHTYPSAQACGFPWGVKASPIDGDGMCADALENTLRDWDTTHPDLIIVEDDPYYFLQFEAYVSGQTHGNARPYNEEAFLDSLEKTFLHFDTEGRVIRLDSFSKTLAPGNRLGWFTANPLFAERLLRATEVTTQTPSGWSQVIITQLLQSWGPGISGYLVWLSRLRSQYEMRRTWMCEAIGRAFDVEEGKNGEGMVAYSKGTRTRIFSFIPPRAGMFLWCKLYLEGNGDYEAMKEGMHDDPEAEYEKKLWLELADEKVLLTPGSYYTPWEGQGLRSTSAAGGQSYEIFFRLAYSMTTREDMEVGIQRMAKVYARAWGL
ncbi:pyridoxal phosphate-dependent transferase [Mucidula mucida]|nr:pyridoxal phosphate-dependent transferase [Mucidula mucida]